MPPSLSSVPSPSLEVESWDLEAAQKRSNRASHPLSRQLFPSLPSTPDESPTSRRSSIHGIAYSWETKPLGSPTPPPPTAHRPNSASSSTLQGTSISSKGGEDSSRYPSWSQLESAGLKASYCECEDDEDEAEVPERNWIRSGRGVLNIASLLLLLAAILGVFVVYPVVRMA